MPSDPSPSPDLRDHVQNVNEQYEYLGRFVEAFESMIGTVRSSCIQLLSVDTQYANWMQVPFYHESMTARPLWAIMRGVIAQMLKDEKFRKAHGIDDKDYNSFRDILACITKEIDELINSRNNLLHGTWIIGYRSLSEDALPEDSLPEFTLYRYKVGKDGLTVPDKLPKNVDNLKALIERCDETRRWIAALNNCLPRSLMKWDIKRTFHCNAGKWECIFPWTRTLGET
jgi:hypothetical protein